MHSVGVRPSRLVGGTNDHGCFGPMNGQELAASSLVAERLSCGSARSGLRPLPHTSPPRRSARPEIGGPQESEMPMPGEKRTVGVRCHSTWRLPNPVTCGLARESDTEVISFFVRLSSHCWAQPGTAPQPVQVLQNPRIRGVVKAHKGESPATRGGARSRRRAR